VPGRPACWHPGLVPAAASLAPKIISWSGWSEVVGRFRLKREVGITMNTEQNAGHDVCRLLQQRDPRVLEDLFALAPRVELSLRWKFGLHIPDEDLKDIVCDAIVAAFERGPRYDPERSSIPVWVNRIAHYLALTFLRAQQHNQGSLDVLGHALALQLETPQFSEGHDNVADQAPAPSPQLEAVLRKLTPIRRRVILLYYYDGLTISEIAAHVGVAESSVRVYLHRAYQDLREGINTDSNYDWSQHVSVNRKRDDEA